ncbi:MAG TPA: FxsA family protein [Aliidongia sp.]|nr:FxsA family protein [Aliidongia sp.]
MPFIWALLLAPFIEIAGFVWLGPYLGVGGTIAFVMLSAVLGFTLLRSQSLAMPLQLRRDLQAGTALPAVIDGAGRVIADFLLIVPGFFSTALGLLLLIPPVRSLIGRFLRRRFEAAGGVIIRTQAGPSDVIEGEFRDVTPEPPTLPRR